MRRSQPCSSATTGGLILASAGAPMLAAHVGFGAWAVFPDWLRAAAGAAVALTLIAGLSISSRPRLGRVTATLGILSTLGFGVPYLMGNPAAALLSLVGTTGALGLLWRQASPHRSVTRANPRPLYEGQAQGAAVAALSLWSLSALSKVEYSLVDLLVTAYALGLSTLLAMEWAIRTRAQAMGRAIAVLAAAVCGAMVALVFWDSGLWALSGLAASAAVTSLLVRRRVPIGLEQASWWEPLLGNPERLLVGTFLTLSVVGTLLLALPYSLSAHRSISIIDAAFTAVSAVCVTGLVVVDTPVHFSTFGQCVILALIQVGGLGIMTFSTTALWALGQRMSLRHETAIATLMSTQDRSQLFTTARRILALTCIAESIGALLLALAFWTQGDAPGTALWRGVFTAVSAFCNAGFALQSTSLMPYQGVPAVLHVVAALIIIGGLSPLVVFSLPTLIRRSAPVSAQAKLSLAAAGVLLIAGFVFILAFEWNHSLAPLPWYDRLHNAWFQSVTLRTAGFNSVDFGTLGPVTVTLMMVWMFIGGSPGGTAGGVKTTTISIVALSVLQAIRGQPDLEAFGKRISERIRNRAMVVIAVATLSGLVALVVIQLTQRLSPEVALFEVVSALGTVGLSIGGTARLDGIGKVVILLCMFIGRVGGLTLFMFLTSRTKLRSMGRPLEDIGVG